MINTIELFGTPTRRIMDPVHGSIPIFQHEHDIISHPLFQRLRHILQNDVVFLVFPGCKHNRLLHSIGTMHTVSAIFRQITSAYLVRSSTEMLKPESQNEIKESIKYLYCCLRIAALLHDTGHAPFSHQFEFSREIKEILNADLFKKLWDGEETGHIYNTIPNEISHENYSVRIAFEILKGIEKNSALNIQPLDILFFLETTEIIPSEKLRKSVINFSTLFTPGSFFSADTSKIEEGFLALLKSFISGELDADKMDYVLRDSYFSGVTYGMFNKDHLLNALRIGFEPYYQDKKIFDIDFSLAIQEKGVGAVEDFIYARYQLYHELYNHKAVSGFRKLLELSINEIMADSTIKAEITSYLTDLKLFANFTDTFFWECFRKYSIEKPDSFCYKLVNRIKLSYIGKRENENEDDIVKLCSRLTISNKRKVTYWKSHIKFSKINSYYNDIKVLISKDGKLELKKISKVTDFFTKFDKKDIYHLFYETEAKT